VADLEGYAAVFFNADDHGTQYELCEGLFERIQPGAFSSALSRGDDVRFLQDHDVSRICGRSGTKSLTLTEDNIGLRFRLSPTNTSIGRDLVENVRQGVISQCSFAFTVDSARWDEENDTDVRNLESVRLYDVSAVSFPAYESTSIRLADDNTDASRHRRIMLAPSRLSTLRHRQRLAECVA
jgi:HK97 family phage prohead protease